MRLFFVLPCFLAWAFGLVIPLSAEEKPITLSLSYTHAGLTEITIKDGKLRYVWHTLRQGDSEKAVERGSLESYDRHQVDVWLTGKELERFRDWVTRRKVLNFDKDYPSASGGSARAAAFQSSLTVIQGDKKQSVSWVGDSKTPKELPTAIANLTSLAIEIEKSRRK